MNTSAHVFADKSSTQPAATNPEYVRAASHAGWVSVNFHIGRGEVRVTKYPHDRNPYAAATIEGPYDPRGRADLTLFVVPEPESIENAVALRDALTKAIAFARKSTKEV